MKKSVLLVLGVMLLLVVNAYADINIAITGSQFEIQNPSTLRIRNVIAPGGVDYPGKWWVDFQWDPVNLVFVPANLGQEQAIDPIYSTTELLLGTWYMTYTPVAS